MAQRKRHSEGSISRDILLFLAGAGSARTSREISNMVALPMNSITGKISALARDALVKRSTNKIKSPAGYRSSQWEITAKGRKAIE